MSEAKTGGLLSRLKVDKYLLLIISMVVAASFLPARVRALQTEANGEDCEEGQRI